MQTNVQSKRDEQSDGGPVSSCDAAASLRLVALSPPSALPAPPMRHRSIEEACLMRTAAHLLAVLILAATGSAVAQQKHLIDPTPAGSLNPEPLPPLQNPDAPSTPAKELFARKSTPFPGPP